MSERNGTKRRYVLCVRHGGYRASLEVRKVYRLLDDAEADRHGMLRIIDESGESYLYPRTLFVPIALSTAARRAIARSA